MMVPIPTIGMSASLADPFGSSVFITAVQWLEGTLLGTIATSVAIVAVAATGMMTLTGRLPIRRGVTVVIGCFILFGASSIVAGLESLARMGDASDLASSPVASAEVSPLSPPPRPPPGYDPYAGAAVPTR